MSPPELAAIASGIEPIRAEIDRKLHGSLMLVTALAPHIHDGTS